MAIQGVWLSYDLGVTGDYINFHVWLDRLQSKECVGSVAYIPRYEYTSNVFTSLKRSIRATIDVKPTDRIYAVARLPSGTTVVGRFIFGNRKAAAWEGLAPQPPTTDEPAS